MLLTALQVVCVEMDVSAVERNQKPLCQNHFKSLTSFDFYKISILPHKEPSYNGFSVMAGDIEICSILSAPQRYISNTTAGCQHVLSGFCLKSQPGPLGPCW